jgi:putative RecB family exonuclease
MDLNELRSKPHLSASSIGTYLDCSLAYRFRYVDKLPSEGTPDRLVFGTAIHSVLADFYMHLMCGTRLSHDDLKTLWEVHWKNSAGSRTDILWKNDNSFESLKTEGEKLLEAFSRFYVLEDTAVIAVEEGFSFNLPEIPVPIIGAYDLVLEDPGGQVTIVDHKTLSRAYSKKEMDASFQGTIYNLAAKANGFASRNIRLRFDLLLKTKDPRYERHLTNRTSDDEKRAIKKIMAVWEGISKGVFIPNDSSFRCEGCGYKSHCQNWPEETL